MIIDYIGVKEINGSLITLDGIRDATFEETVLIRLENGTERSGRIVQMEGDRVVIQVFEGTNGLSLSNTRTRLQGHPVDMPLSPELLGRIFDGAGRIEIQSRRAGNLRTKDPQIILTQTGEEAYV